MRDLAQGVGEFTCCTDSKKQDFAASAEDPIKLAETKGSKRFIKSRNDAYCFSTASHLKGEISMKKKITAILTASVMAFSLAACGGSGNGAQSGTPEPAAEPASTAAAVESKGADSAAADSTGAGSGAANSITAESAAAAPAGEETEIQVFIAASLNTVMQEVAAAFNEQYPNVKITYNADSSGTLLTQIEEGYACDVFFSAAQKQMNKLEQ
ncbi:MAG: extracellular solute-binding protein, partial [Succiniclasticum sp.]|nr:extracellular solute-binding protein [Succiniclasticum sp.]